MMKGYEEGPNGPSPQHIEHPLPPPPTQHPFSPLGDNGCSIASMEQPIQTDRPWATCDCSQYVHRLEGRLDQMEDFLLRIESSVSVELSAIKKLLMTLVKSADEEMRTSISNDLRDGIISIDVPSEGKDVPPPPPQPMLKPKVR
uniref:Uncharacterized protein n=1 Tax=Cucumis melo TaxID=3656 RepID=A0A9I9DGV4_CUCME